MGRTRRYWSFGLECGLYQEETSLIERNAICKIGDFEYDSET